MSDDYTPDTDEVREIYALGRAHLRRHLMGTSPLSVDAYYRDFARWLNRTLADAWDEGYMATGGRGHHEREATNPYREDSRHG